MAKGLQPADNKQQTVQEHYLKISSIVTTISLIWQLYWFRWQRSFFFFLKQDWEYWNTVESKKLTDECRRLQSDT